MHTRAADPALVRDALNYRAGVRGVIDRTLCVQQRPTFHALPVPSGRAITMLARSATSQLPEFIGFIITADD